MKTLLITVLSLATTAAFSQDAPRYLNVLASNGLNMRSKPEADARIVTKVAYGKRVEVLEETNAQLQLGWVNDHWYSVKYRGREGFIYGGYLSELTPPKEMNLNRLSDILPLYATQAFTVEGKPAITVEGNDGDTLKHTLVMFKNGAELELESETDRMSSMLILGASVQEAYVLLEALLKQNQMKGDLGDLRFVKGNDGQLSRVSNAQETISIKPYADGLTAIRLTSYSGVN